MSGSGATRSTRSNASDPHADLSRAARETGSSMAFTEWSGGRTGQRMKSRIRDLVAILQCHVRFTRQSQHVKSGQPWVKVLSSAPEVLRVEQRADMPPQPVSLLPQIFDERRRVGNLVILDVQHRTITGENLLRALQYLQFESLNVNLHEPHAPCTSHVVQPDAGYF